MIVGQRRLIGASYWSGALPIQTNAWFKVLDPGVSLRVTA